jgi:hypothetical protein
VVGGHSGGPYLCSRCFCSLSRCVTGLMRHDDLTPGLEFGSSTALVSNRRTGLRIAKRKTLSGQS